MGKQCLPPHLHGRHDDWIWIVSWVPRSWTARCGWRWPAPPVLLLGRSGWTTTDRNTRGLHTHHHPDYYEKIKHKLPIPAPGHWLLTAVLWAHFLPLPMFAWKFRNGDYFSLGIARWDDVDNYYDLMRIRFSGTKGRIAGFIVLLGILAFLYFVVWPWLVARTFRI